MAALPEEEMGPQYGVDPETMEEGIPLEDEQMPPELMEMLGQDGAVDPNAAPADPMLGPVDEGDDEYEPALGEVERREEVELDLLNAICKAAKAVEVGIGAENPQFAQAFGQAAASLGQCYASLTQAEQAEKKTDEPVSEF